MPFYTFINKTSKEVVSEELMAISEMEQHLVDCPELDVMPSAPGIVSGTGTRIKVDDGFKDRLREIKKAHRGSTIDV